MKKIVLIAILCALFVSLFESCRSREHCPAYGNTSINKVCKGRS